MAKLWQLYEAKGQFSHLVEEAIDHGPQTVTKFGEPIVIVVSVKDWEKMKKRKKKTLFELFESCPGDLSELEIGNLKDVPKDINF